MAVLSASPTLRGLYAALLLLFVPAAQAQQGTIRQDRELSEKFSNAERLFWLDNWVKARDLYAECEEGYATSDPAKALISKFSRLRADAETKLSYTTVSRLIAADLERSVARNHPDVRLRGLLVKATADLSIHDPSISGREWQQVRELAHSLKESGWEERAEGELGIVAYLRGETEQAITLNTEAFEKAKRMSDVAGMIRDLSLKGVGLLERNTPDHAITYFDQALELVRTNPDTRFPLMAYMGKAQALDMTGDDHGSGELLIQAKKFVDNVGMTVYRADLLIALGSRAAKHGNLAEAELEFDQAATAARESHMPRPFADAVFHGVQVREQTGDWIGASQLIWSGLQADRKLIDIQFLPQHLAEAAQIEAHLGNIATAEEYLSQASDVIEGALATAPSESVKASLIATMSEVYVADFRLALEQEHNLAKAFSILEQARGRVMADHLRSQVEGNFQSTPRAKELEQQIANTQLTLLSSPSNPVQRGELLEQLDETESELEPLEFAHDSVRRPVHVAPISLNALENSLAPNELLVEYVLGSTSSFALAITRESAHAYPLQSLSSIQPSVDQYTREVGGTAVITESERRRARQLFDAVLAPIEELRQKDRLIVIPDSVLNLVGFDSLVDDNNRFLVRTHTVSYAPSATVLMMLRKRPQNPDARYSLLAFGAPELPNQTKSESANHSAPTRELLDLEGGTITNLKAAAGEVYLGYLWELKPQKVSSNESR